MKVQATAIRQEKKCHKECKKVRLSLFADVMITYVANPKESLTKKGGWGREWGKEGKKRKERKACK